jgi:aspartyl-tRNA(Asn)/glutamyl-tRNA(Gln) amidotransferase subunit A
MDLCFQPAYRLVEEMRRGGVSPVEVVEAYLERIDKRQPEINAYITVIHDEARRVAREHERALRAGETPGPLFGLPLALKDLLALKKGVRHTFGALPFARNVAQLDEVFVERLEAAGAIVIGKTNTPEFGFTGVTDNLLVGPTRNPVDPRYNAGGSSGGSAAAVADGQAAIAQGSDTGGSIRVPAGFCGAVGLNPTFGRVPVAFVYRPTAFARHTPFTCVGPITRTVRDAALVLQAMAGPHPRDPLSLPEENSDLMGAADRGADGVHAAFTPDMGIFPVEPEVARVVTDAARALGKAGVHVDEVDPRVEGPHMLYADLLNRSDSLSYAGYFDTLSGEIDWLERHRHELPPAFVRHIESGQAVDAMQLQRDDELRTRLFDAMEDLFERHDVLLLPTTSIAGIRNAETWGTTEGPHEVEGDAVDPTFGWAMTYLFNLTGHPAISVPAGRTRDGLPVGLQIVAPRFREDLCIAVAAALERVRPWPNAG